MHPANPVRLWAHRPVPQPVAFSPPVRAAAALEWNTFYLEDGSEVATADLQFMHLRHTAVTELAIAGCTTLEIAGITGHTIQSVNQILERYLVRTSDLAAAGAASAWNARRISPSWSRSKPIMKMPGRNRSRTKNSDSRVFPTLTKVNVLIPF